MAAPTSCLATQPAISAFSPCGTSNFPRAFERHPAYGIGLRGSQGNAVRMHVGATQAQAVAHAAGLSQGAGASRASQRRAPGRGSPIQQQIDASPRVQAQRRAIEGLFKGQRGGPVQRIHVHMSGSGVDKGDESLGNKFGNAYAKGSKPGKGRETHTVSGPGTDVEGAHLEEQWAGSGTTQSSWGQDARILNAVRRIGQAWQAGDREILLTGFSRGGGNAIEVARFIQLHGLLDAHNQVIKGTTGAPIAYLGLLDPVPSESPLSGEFIGGTARTLTGVRTRDSVSDALEESIDSRTRTTRTTQPEPRRLEMQASSKWYEDLKVPANVRHVTSVLAQGENRGAFEPYRVQLENDKATARDGDVIPFAVHSQVGGTFYPGTEGTGALLAFDTLLNGAKKAGVDFPGLSGLSEQERRDYVERLWREPRAEEDFTTRAMSWWRPNLRRFSADETGPVAQEFLRGLAERSNLEEVSPLFTQFGLEAPMQTNMQALPDRYLGALTGPQPRTAETQSRLPRTGGALLLGTVFADSLAIAAVIIGLLIVIISLVRFVKHLRRH